MGPGLPVLIIILSVAAVISAVVLVAAAVQKPRIGALTERAAIAVILAVFGAVYSVVAVNTELDQAMFTTDVGRLAVRLIVVLLLAIPAWWTILYLTGRLGGGQ